MTPHVPPPLAVAMIVLSAACLVLAVGAVRAARREAVSCPGCGGEVYAEGVEVLDADERLVLWRCLSCQRTPVGHT